MLRATAPELRRAQICGARAMNKWKNRTPPRAARAKEKLFLVRGDLTKSDVAKTTRCPGPAN